MGLLPEPMGDAVRVGLLSRWQGVRPVRGVRSNGSALDVVGRQAAGVRIAAQLRRAILGGEIKPGARLNVEELAEKFGVSLTPVRGAIQQLATEGLIEIRPRSA